MTVFKATCPSCGDVDVASESVRLHVNQRPERSFYTFTCVCGSVVTKSAPAEVIRLLAVGGVTSEMVVVPLEALEEHHGAPLCWDEVLDFRLALDKEEEWV